MTREQILQAAYNSGFEKGAVSRGLSDVALGSGPAQMEAALRLLGQAKALGNPTDSELSRHDLTRERFVTTLQRMRNERKLSDAKVDKRESMTGGGLAGGVGGAALGAAAYGVPGAIGAGMLGAGAGVLGGKIYADVNNARVLRAMKLLKDRGVLTPELLRKAYPILT